VDGVCEMDAACSLLKRREEFSPPNEARRFVEEFAADADGSRRAGDERMEWLLCEDSDPLRFTEELFDVLRRLGVEERLFCRDTTDVLVADVLA